VRGRLAALHGPAVAVVGARAATPTGLRLGYELGRDVAAAGLTVISGLARGVDGAAHQGALDAGGSTVAVLGSGVDVVYPRQHAALAGGILTSGAIVSEFPPGTPPRAEHFPQRNRIISGLSLAVVVVEASERSGSLITARMALEQGRDVLAVPGNPASGSYRGSHALIKDGARLVETVKDVLEEIRWRPRGRPAPAGGVVVPAGTPLEAAMDAGEPYSIEEIAARCERSVAEILAELSALEIAGRVTRVAGGRYVRLD
jgi:DNA processing protein